MTAELAKQSILDWITANHAHFPILAGIETRTMGDTENTVFPFIGIMETGITTLVDGGVIMHGVDDITAQVDVISVPESEADAGTSLANHNLIVDAVWQILANRDGILFCEERNNCRIFDIRASSPTMTANDGHRVSTIPLTIIACPI